MAALDLVREGLADVVQEGAALDQCRLDAQLGGHDAGDVRGLDEVSEHVLAVAGAVLEPAECRQQPLVEIGDADVGEGVAGGAQAQLVDLGLALLVGLLDAVRVDAAVEDEPLEGEPADLAPHRIEARQQHGLGGVVDDQVDAGDGLVGADVAALAADDAALHVVAGQVHHADDGLGGLLARDALDGLDDDLAGLGGAFGAGLVLDACARARAASRRASASTPDISSALACSAVSPATRSSSRSNSPVRCSSAASCARPASARAGAGRPRARRVRAGGRCSWAIDVSSSASSAARRRSSASSRASSSAARRSRSASSASSRRASAVSRAISCWAAVRASAEDLGGLGVGPGAGGVGFEGGRLGLGPGGAQGRLGLGLGGVAQRLGLGVHLGAVRDRVGVVGAGRAATSAGVDSAGPGSCAAWRRRSRAGRARYRRRAAAGVGAHEQQLRARRRRRRRRTDPDHAVPPVSCAAVGRTRRTPARRPRGPAARAVRRARTGERPVRDAGTPAVGGATFRVETSTCYGALRQAPYRAVRAESVRAAAESGNSRYSWYPEVRNAPATNQVSALWHRRVARELAPAASEREPAPSVRESPPSSIGGRRSARSAARTTSWASPGE